MQSFDFLPAIMPDSAVVFASPHSGRCYPSDFLAASMLDPIILRSSEDAYVDRFLRAAPAAGAPVLLGGVPRAYVDYNRAASELDPALITGVSARGLNPRISSGLGVIPRVVAGGRAIYRGKITRAEAEMRLRLYWHPYHDKLTQILAEQRARHGRAILLDMHSMPRDAVSMNGQHTSLRPDIVLGDRFGASAHSEITEAVAAVFTAAGLRVARNSPFAGAYITQRHGLPSSGQHAIQIEIDRGLYLDERKVSPSSSFDSFQNVMDGIVRDLVAIGRSDTIPLAAE
ncbi:N-formylglutamate amidohydrolase [Roseinatronobacter bogoriensis]|uniref:N-formylglutamate amidohydrolase n=1 Tax=Roseinatronobacter bogoriensis subsp. barguzinensis TaxID=441209 RepID=A0A2K8KAG9_9RHOB|nr:MULTISPECIES: N-formylglutamate amidohydrolase [Rhodobaca]ATX64883.1 N-formylglutamate amidohydrolase [Rhodobaca barguzinensis]MBB4208684.1 N-formylglutamate deformylase [Rhodobaca bogoriensis DSM 18756]TDW38048.1 N-formylglutamate deformylase [Rhodobaca barguzinensis]TDY69782.1 N-formylglutamate deformylase [Rhodobaca bogoriensis DSM 18756]